MAEHSDRTTSPNTPRTAEPRVSDPGSAGSSTQVTTQSPRGEHPQQEAWLGTDDPNRSRGNTSWGAIIAGVFTFLALMVLLGTGAAALGLQAGGTAVAIWAAIGAVISFLAAGYVTGALAVRSGLLHGFITWAASLIAVLFLVGWLGASALGAFGSAIGTAASATSQAVNVTSEDAQGAASEVDGQDASQAADQAQDQASQAADQAQQTAEEVAPEAGAGAWWAFAGILIGGILSALGGVAGSRSVINKREELVTNRGQA